MTQKKWNKLRGFTLIEVLVALVIMGLMLSGLYRTISQQADERLRLNERFFGQTAAWNRLLEQYQVVEGWTPRGSRLAERSGNTELYGRTWYWEVETEATLGDNFYRYEVKTYGDADTDNAPSLVTLVAFFIIE